MTPTRLRECLAVLGWTQRGLAAFLGCDERMAREWAAGKRLMPPRLAEWVELRARHAEAHPPPADWQTRVGRGP
jgi:transcriptional regulator with XRE-family HTH domain